MNEMYLNGSIALYGFLIRSGWLSHPLLRAMANGSSGSCGSNTGDAGIFSPVLDKLMPLARNAWAFGTTLLIVVASLGGLFFALKGAAGASVGGGGMTAGAIIGMVAIIIVVLMVFLLLPQLSCMLQSSAPAAPF
jgi:hypothetical protein